jgi:TPR repeat protein
VVRRLSLSNRRELRLQIFLLELKTMRKPTSHHVESGDDLFVKANHEWDSGKAKQAFKLFLQAADAGHVSAKNSVGFFLDHGIGARKNNSQAMLWYRQAARKGDISACSNIAICYRNAGNIKQARIWFAKALEKGDTSSAIELAKLLLITKRKSNTAKAVRYLRTAVKSKYVSAADKQQADKLLARITAR